MSASGKQVLDERAQILARPPPLQARADELLLLATFTLAGERYGIEAALVREVARLPDFTPLPGVSDFLVGVTNLRGEILAIINLRKFFGLGATGLTDLSRVVVLGESRNEFGVLADQMDDLLVLRKETLLGPPPAARAGREYVRGLTPDALIVLDGARLLRDPRLYIDQGQDNESPERPKEER